MDSWKKLVKQELRSTKARGILTAFLVFQLSATAAYAQWETVQRPIVNVPAAFSCCAAAGDTLFAGTYGPGGVFRSTDDGATWTNVFHQSFIYSIYIDDGHVYIGTQYAIYQSSDWGQSWRQDSLEFAPPAIVLSLTGIGPLLMAGTDEGVFLSSDWGAHWAEPQSMFGAQWARAVLMTDGRMYVGFGPLIASSSDSGKTWDTLAVDFHVQQGPSPAIRCLISDGNSILAATTDGVYRSSDNGQHWAAADSGLPHDPYGGHSMSIYSLSENNGKLYAGALNVGSIYVSSDDGTTWKRDSPFITQRYVSGFCFTGSRAWASTFSGLYEKSGGVDMWRPVFAQFPQHLVPRFLQNVSGRLFISGYADYFEGANDYTMYSDDGGETWHHIDTTGINPSVTGFLNYDGYLYGGTPDGIVRSTDGGVKWTVPDPGSPPYGISQIVDYHGRILAYGTYGAPGGFMGSGITQVRTGLYESFNEGATWRYLSLEDTLLNSLIVVGNDLFASTSSGVLLSTDGGVSWMPRNQGLPEGTLFFSLVDSKGSLYLSSYDMVYKSTNLGDDWSLSTTMPIQNPHPPEYDATNLYTEGPFVLAANTTGVYYDAGNGIWPARNTGLTPDETNINALAFHGNYVYAATDSGVLRRPLMEIADGDTGTVILSEYRLNQNYPNPFNPATTVSYYLPISGQVTIRVYDVLGREVSTLVNGDESSGEHEVNFDGASLASGVYFCRLTAPGVIETRKMLLEK